MVRSLPLFSVEVRDGSKESGVNQAKQTKNMDRAFISWDEDNQKSYGSKQHGWTRISFRIKNYDVAVNNPFLSVVFAEVMVRT